VNEERLRDIIALRLMIDGWHIDLSGSFSLVRDKEAMSQSVQQLASTIITELTEEEEDRK